MIKNTLNFHDHLMSVMYAYIKRVFGDEMIYTVTVLQRDAFRSWCTNQKQQKDAWTLNIELSSNRNSMKSLCITDYNICVFNNCVSYKSFQTSVIVFLCFVLILIISITLVNPSYAVHSNWICFFWKTIFPEIFHQLLY